MRASFGVGLPLRILHVIPAYYPAVRYGGPIRSAHGLAAAQVRLGHQVEVFTTTLDGPGDLDVPTDSPVDVDGVQVSYFPVPALRRLCWSPRLGMRLRSRIRQFDVMHLHSVYLWPTNAAARCAARAGVPYLLAPRGMLVPELIRRRNRWIKRAWIALVERRTIAQAGGLHVTTETEADDLRSLRLDLTRVFCVPNGVDVPAVTPALEHGPFRDLPRPYALFLSRLNWKKGLDRLIAAWAQVPDRTLIIAGNDDESLRPKLEALAARHRVDDRIRFIGAVADEHKWALYANAELFVLPSYSENFGNVVAEAMAMGCPVVVTPEVGLASFVTAHGAGRVCAGEPHVLAATLRALLADPQRAALGDRGRRAVSGYLSWNGVARQMDDAYVAAIAARRP